MNAITDILDTILNLLSSQGLQEWGAWSYPLLVVLVIIEGPVVTLLAAAAASLGYMRLPLVMVSALVGSAIADTLWYYLGYIHAEERILRYGRWLGLRRHHVEQLQLEMQQHAPKLLFVAKFVSLLATPTLIAAGMARVPFRRWFPIVFLGELIWVAVLAFIGFRAAEVVRQVELGLHYLPLVGGLALLILLPLVARRLKSGRFKETALAPDAAARRLAAAPTPYTNGSGHATGTAPRRTASSPATAAECNGHHTDEHLHHLGKPQAEREPTEV